MNYLLTFDIGTTSVKTCIFTEKFWLVAISAEEYELLTPKKDIVELDPDVYWTAIKSGLKKVLELSKVCIEDIRVITVATQGETLIPVDIHGKALCNAIVWLDARAKEETDIIKEGFTEDEFYRKTGISEVGPACPVSKILWFKRRRKELYDNTFKFLLLEDYIINKLTGKFVTEQSLMSSTGYFDINNNKLWEEMLGYIDIGTDKFPEIYPCGEKISQLKPEIASELGLSAATIVSTGAFDQTCSAVGAGNVMPGIVSETTGTALVIAATTEEPDYNNPGKINIIKHYNHNFLMLPYCSTAGMVLKWFKDSFCQYEIEASKIDNISVYELLDIMAAAVEPAAKGLVLLPYFAGTTSPEVDPTAKGVFFGISLDTKKEHFVRAILEAIGFMLRENIELLEKSGVEPSEIRSLGGGSKSHIWNAIKSDITKKRIVVMDSGESTSLGAAMLGAVSVGMYKSIDEICSQYSNVRCIYHPDYSNSGAYDKAYEIYLKLYKNLKELFHYK